MIPLKGNYDVIITGGGLAGLTSAILLAKKGLAVLLIEKKSYPFHKVCGEYVSNEVLDILGSMGLDPFQQGASRISRLRVSTPSGHEVHSPLGLGGFGLSRYKLDHAMAALAQQNGAEIITGTKVIDIIFKGDHFETKLNSGEVINSKIAMGSYGKRDTLDKKLNRDFFYEHTGYLGVKYHIKTNYPDNEVGLDNFAGGYCGIVKIEDDRYNLCYLYKRNRKTNFNSVHELEEKVLFRNPVIKNIFLDAHFIFEEPEVINEISFSSKQQVENHILMCGDSAGLITPLCGNGMAIAIHSGVLLSNLIAGLNLERNISMKEQVQLEGAWQQAWNKNFRSRLMWGRRIQSVFGNFFITELGIRSIHLMPALESWLISKTHGKPL